MHIAAVGWSYVVLMMAITEDSVVAGIMTFFLYGVLPVTIILYITGTGGRRRRKDQERQRVMQERQQAIENDERLSAEVLPDPDQRRHATSNAVPPE